MKKAEELFEIIIDLYSKLVGNKHKCNLLISRIHLVVLQCEHVNSSPESLNNLLINTINFMKPFSEKSYFVRTWMSNTDDETFDCLLASLSEFTIDLHTDSVFKCKEFDNRDLHSIIRENLVEHSSILLDKPRVLNEEIIENIKSLRADHKLRQYNRSLLSYERNRACLIDKGGYGDVFRGTLKGFPVAIKVAEFTDGDVRKEALILQTYCFPGVIRFFGVDNADNPTVIVMELAVCSLFQALYIKEYDIGWTLDKKIDILVECCTTFTFLHYHDFDQRDIKSKNILIMPDGHIKVIDFGLSSSRAIGKTSAHTNLKGTYYYLAPELLLSSLSIDKKYNYDEKTDVYALGVLMNEVMTGEIPFNKNSVELNIGEFLNIMIQNNFNEKPRLMEVDSSDQFMSDKLNELRDWISLMLSKDPSRRPRLYTLMILLQSLKNNGKDLIYNGLETIDPVIVENVVTSSVVWVGYYSGEMRGEARYGQGVLKCFDGTVLRGTWVNNVLNGFVQINFASGDVYEGYCCDDLRHGQGLYKSKGTVFSQYQGNYSRDKRHGLGEMKYVNDNAYSGNWHDGVKCGEGTFIWACGAQLRGKFKDDTPVSGIFTLSDGVIKSWQKQGANTVVLEDGRIFLVNVVAS